MVRVEREIPVDASREAVWSFVTDPRNKVRMLPPVTGYTELESEGYRWSIDAPLVGSVEIDTPVSRREENRLLEFGGEHKLATVAGRHLIKEEGDDVVLRLVFGVESPLPGVETTFRKLFYREIRRREDEIRERIEEYEKTESVK